jgi:hypothetical protein
MRIYSLIFCFILNFSYAQQKNDKAPIFPPKNHGEIKIIKNTPKITYNFNLGDLKQNGDGLYCYKTDEISCNILDGKATIFAYYQTKGDDNPSLIPYTCAKGEFLEGKYDGKWVFYDEKERIIKKENWEKGKLISRKEYNFNQCNLKEEYKLSWKATTQGYNSIEQFKKDFFVKNDKFKCLDGIINQMTIFYKNADSHEFITLYKGQLTKHEIIVTDAPVGLGNYAILYKYDVEGNLESMSFAGEEKHKFIKGTGHFTEYYTPIYKSQKYELLVIKSEGEIKNNFKIGKWKYYNRNGSVDSTKTYTLKDSVDVRFPYCIFNKKEPCF